MILMQVMQQNRLLVHVIPRCRGSSHDNVVSRVREAYSIQVRCEGEANTITKCPARRVYRCVMLVGFLFSR